MANEDRRYSDQEVGEILRKAMERAPGNALAPTEGMSLTELKSIATEVGIDPARVELAAHSLIQSHGSGSHPLLGAATDVDHEIRVPGTLPADQIPEALALIRQVTGERGDVTEVHGALDWSSSTDMGSRWVSVSTADGHSTIRASARMRQGAIIAFLPSGIASLVALIATTVSLAETGNLLILALLPIILVGLYLIPRSLWSRSALKTSENLRKLVSDLGDLVEPDADPDPVPGSEEG